MTTAVAISFWNRNQKTRASTATSEDGGAVGMIELSMLRGPIRLARACFYATRNFAAQVRHRRDSSVASAANIDIGSPSLFQAIKFQIMNAFWNFVGPLLGLGARPEELTFVQISLRGVVVFIATLIMVRLGHKRSLSRKTAFDAVLLVILASVLSRAINGMAAFSRPMIGHCGDDFKNLYRDIHPKLQTLFGSKQPVFLSTSSAWGVMEASIRSLVDRVVLCCMCGAFSDKWLDVARRCGKNAEPLQVDWGKHINHKDVNGALASGKFDAVTLIHNETSTGVMNPLPEMCCMLAKYTDVVLIVDTVFS